MHQTIYRRHCRHRIPEYTVPFSEREVACHDHASALVPFGKEVEENFHFFRGLLHVPDVVKDHDVEPVEFDERPVQLVFLLRSEERFHKTARRGEVRPDLLPDEFVSEGAGQVRLPASRKAEDQDVLGLPRKGSFDQQSDFVPDFHRQEVRVEDREGLFPRQAGFAYVAFHASVLPSRKFAVDEASEGVTAKITDRGLREKYLGWEVPVG